MSINTENLDLYEKVNFLFKNYLGFPNTDKTKAFFEEVGVSANNYLYGGEVFLDDIPLSLDFDISGVENSQSELNLSSDRFEIGTTQIKTDSTSVIRKFVKIKLEKIDGTNRGYYCRDQSGSNILSDAIQFNKVTDSDGNRPYLYELFDHNKEQLFPSAETGNWIFDVKNGVVNFPDETTKVSETKLPYLTFYKYIGRKGINKLNKDDIIGLNQENENIKLRIDDLSSNVYFYINSEINNVNDNITDLSNNVYSKEKIDSSFNYLKTYTDNVASGLDIKESVKLATNSNLDVNYNNGNNGVGATLTSNINGRLIIDDISNNNINDRILIKDQINKVENGIYIIKELGGINSKFKLERAVPDDEGRELTGGSFVFVEEGIKNANNGFVFINNGTPIIGTDNIEVAQFSGAGQLIMGRGLAKDGNTVFINDSIYTRFSNLDVSLNNLETRVDSSLNNLETRVDSSLNNLETRVDASFNDMYTKSYINNRLDTLETSIDASFNDVYTKSQSDELFLTGLTIKQNSDISNNKNLINDINTISFDYDSGLKVTDLSNGEVEISLGSHWKEIRINDTPGIIPVGEETLNLKTDKGISIIPNSNDDPQSLTFSLDPELFKNGLDVVTELPTTDVSENQIVIRSIDNTIHRYDASSNRWISVGGSSNESNYSQVLNFDVLTYNDGTNALIVNYYSNNTNVTSWNKIAEAEYEYLPNTDKIVISYNAFITSNSNIVNSNLPGFGGRTGIMEWVLCIDDDVITNSRNFIQVDLIERYVNIRAIINFTENNQDIDISKNTILVSDTKTIKIYARSIYNRNNNLVKLHQTQNGLARPDNLEVASIGVACDGLSCKNIVDYKTEILDISESTILYSPNNSINDISNNWSVINFMDEYQPPYKTKNVILRYTPFITFSDNTYLGVRGRNSIIEWVFKIGDTILPNSRQFIHLDLIEKYFTIETNIKIEEVENLSKNIISEWNAPKSIKLFARSIFNSDNNVRLNISQLSSTIKKPNLEIICIAHYDGQTKVTTNTSENNSGATTSTSDDRIKHNEQKINNGISIIEQLEPKYYIKTNDLYDEDHNFHLNENGEPVDLNGNKLGVNYTMEAGLIAQDIKKIPELQHVVLGYEKDFNGELSLPQNKSLTVKYNDIFVYAIQALKEVINKNKILENKVRQLEETVNR